MMTDGIAPRHTGERVSRGVLSYVKHFSVLLNLKVVVSLTYDQ